MVIGFVPTLALADNSIDEANRGIVWSPIETASQANAAWGGGFTHADDAFIEFDVTVEGLHTLTLPPWPRTDDLWYQGSAVMFLSPQNPTSQALPVTISYIAVNGETRISNRAFTAGGGFWNETAGTFFGNIELGGGASVANVPGFEIQRFTIPDVVNVTEIIPWLIAGTSELMGSMTQGDIVTVTIWVGDPPELEGVEPTFDPDEWVRPTRPADPQLSDFPEGTRFIALTFDDGPNVGFTPQVLDALYRYGAVATFYVNPIHFSPSTRPIVYRMISEGHDVDNHGWDHTSFGADILGSGFTYTTVEEGMADISRASQAIFDVTGIWPFSFRSPFFEWGGANNILLGMDRYFNMPFVGTGMDTNDWQDNRTPQDIADTVLNNANPAGGIVLLHDTTQRAVDSISLIIPEMQSRGYEFVTVRQLMMLTGSMPELFGDSMRTGGNINAWVPVRRAEPVAFWPDYPYWWEQDWWTSEIPPWVSGIAGAGILPAPYEPAAEIPPTLTHLRLVLGSAEYSLDGIAGELDTAAISIDGRTMVPSGFITDILGIEVEGNTAPLRHHFEAMGAEVIFYAPTNAIYVSFVAPDTTLPPPPQGSPYGMVLRHTYGADWGSLRISPGFTDDFYTVTFDIKHSRVNAPFISVQPNLQQPDGGWGFTDEAGESIGTFFAPANRWNHLSFTFNGSQSNGDLTFATDWPRVVGSSFYIDNIVITNSAGVIVYENDFEDGIGDADSAAYANGVVELVPVPNPTVS